MNYLYNVTLPFSNSEIYYRELSSKDQLNLSKINVLFPSNEDKTNTLDYIKLLKNIISNCIENTDVFSDLNIIEYVLFITKLRIVSIGNELILTLNVDKEDKKEDVKITIDLNFFMKCLYDTFMEALQDNILIYKNISVELDWPKLKYERELLKAKNNSEVLDSIMFFIKTIKTNDDKVIEFSNFEINNIKEIYNKLPLSLKNLIENKVIKMINHLSNKNLFGIKWMDGFSFNFYNSSYDRFMRYMFSGNLRNIYQEYYILASRNINPLYVDTLSIADRTVYCSFVEEEMKAREENNNNDDSGNITDLQKLINEFE